MNQEESEHNEVDGMKKGVDSTGEVMYMCFVTITLNIIMVCISSAKYFHAILLTGMR